MMKGLSGIIMKIVESLHHGSDKKEEKGNSMNRSRKGV
jgi:hypothetical protein